mmetsp:Transcript_42574/g.113974  ORF Transcript_42574/g.113974 Transcript_42574/m.113974 type:complete len:252 (-) Transcript_42574:259-1014(-)
MQGLWRGAGQDTPGCHHNHGGNGRHPHYDRAKRLEPRHVPPAAGGPGLPGHRALAGAGARGGDLVPQPLVEPDGRRRRDVARQLPRQGLQVGAAAAGVQRHRVGRRDGAGAGAGNAPGAQGGLPAREQDGRRRLPGARASYGGQQRDADPGPRGGRAGAPVDDGGGDHAAGQHGARRDQIRQGAALQLPGGGLHAPVGGAVQEPDAPDAVAARYGNAGPWVRPRLRRPRADRWFRGGGSAHGPGPLLQQAD